MLELALEKYGSNGSKSKLTKNEGIVLKTLIKIHSIIMLMFIIFTSSLFSNNLPNYLEKSDSLKILEKYSLFSEYHKNKDFASALPYGWEVLEMDPAKFKKWIYYKMEDCLWYLHDSTDVALEVKESYEDTIIYLYDMALEYYPDDKAYFKSHKAFIMEGWIDAPDEDIIKEYELAIEYDKNLSSYYYHRLGQLYMKNQSDENDYKNKALDLYTYLQEREPDNPQWTDELEKLVENVEELVILRRKIWQDDKDDLAKAWNYSRTAMSGGMYKEAIEGLEFLVSKSPETVNYWNQLQTAYQKLEQYNNAEDALLKLIELDPEAKEHYLNLGIVYNEQGRPSQARRYYLKASDVGEEWALPIFYEGFLYEKAAGGCGEEFDKKCVYQLALDTYKRAKRMDPTLQQAQDRINALSTSVPSQEDYFFRGYKSGAVIPISDACPGWIGKSITVP
jgi:tetratricopeptide (TPR) repeat protein